MLSLALYAAVLFLFGLGTVSYIAMVMGCFYLRRLARSTPQYDRGILLKSPLVAGVSVLAIASEASPEMFAFVRRLLDLEFGRSEIVLVLDGPDDAAMDAWSDEFHLCVSPRGATDDLQSRDIRGIFEPRDPLRLVVVEKDRGGQADAFNAGIRVAAFPVIGLFDPLCRFEPTVMLSLIRPMLEDPARTVGVCGLMPSSEPVAQASGNGESESGSFLSARFGELESVRLWLARCAAFAGWNLLLPVPGAASLVTREAAVAAGGFTAGPFELFLAVHAYFRSSGKPYRIAFVPEGSSWARRPRSLGDLLQKNESESQDLAAALRNRKSFGLRAISWGLPGIVCLRCLRPLVETAAYLLVLVGFILGWFGAKMAGLILLSTAGVGIIVSMAAVVLKELVEFRGSDPTRLAQLFFATIPENLGYRQLRNLWMIAGFFLPAAKSPRRG